jgi:hypothetical protein
MKYFTISLILLSASLLSSQSSDLIIESGAMLYVHVGSQIGSDFITVNEGGQFFMDDPSCVTPGTEFRGGGGGVTPVELSSFTAELNGTKVTLKWTTETEVNNYGFEILRTSTQSLPYQGGKDEATGAWEKIGFVEGNGNSNSPKQYSFIDNNPVGGNKFSYRLKQVDIDGKFEYSPIVEIEICPDQFVLSQNYPNPFNPTTKIRYQLPTEAVVTLKVYDMLGNELFTLINEEIEAGIYEIEFDINELASGTYFYRLLAQSREGSESFISTKKMVFLQ